MGKRNKILLDHTILSFSIISYVSDFLRFSNYVVVGAAPTLAAQIVPNATKFLDINLPGPKFLIDGYYIWGRINKLAKDWLLTVSIREVEVCTAI